ncbi:MAG: C-methyltransferase [Chitinophagaceae bacterium]|nr:C-methyltransferase [Chitinophagaceae bacterium]
MSRDIKNANMYKEITKCRISGSTNLVHVLSLGNQSLTGVFPRDNNENLTDGPLDLVWCPESKLLQLKQSYSLTEMYGENYGYRSGLNSSMVEHLVKKIRALEVVANLKDGDLVLDIGSNDATSLKAYSKSVKKIGMDPSAEKFKEFYNADTDLIIDFFSADKFLSTSKGQKANIITSIAMFYDLENPIAFVKDIEACLCDEGIWHFEQSYMPSMLRADSYDTICHEHLEFYSLEVIKNMLEGCGLRILDVQMNSINGGSFAVTACKKEASYRSNWPIINWLLEEEREMGLDTPKPYLEFAARVNNHRKKLRGLISSLVSDGKKIFGYGASTKGNVLLQYCGFSSNEISCIAEINSDKFGKFTPGTKIPIVSEGEAKQMRPDFFLVLPWHFKDSILRREEEFLLQGGKFIFPLPVIEII